MKVVILAGGFGTRLSELTDTIPKPMVEIGSKPILWHILKIYSAQGFNDFIICLGYKGYIIKEYFANYFMHQSDITIDLEKNEVKIHKSKSEPWKITLVDTGIDTLTGSRIKRIKEYVNNETFMLTYGDGVSNINLNELLKFHRSYGKYATLTAIRPKGRFGSLDISDRQKVNSFQEKPDDGGWINGGFFVLEPEIFRFIKEDNVMWEGKPLQELASAGKLMAYKHNDFWMCMDTMRDKAQLEKLWNSKKVPWKIWK